MSSPVTKKRRFPGEKITFKLSGQENQSEKTDKTPMHETGCFSDRGPRDHQTERATVWVNLFEVKQQKLVIRSFGEGREKKMILSQQGREFTLYIPLPVALDQVCKT